MTSKNKDITLILLPALFLLGMVGLGILRLKRDISIWLEVDFLFIASYFIWIVLESKITKKDYNSDEKDSHDAGTYQLYAIGQGLTFLTALLIKPLLTLQPALLLSCFILFCTGIVFRLWAIKTLGDFYSHKVRKAREHKIIENGPYRFVRHPAYTGMIVANSGITIYFFNWVTAFCFVFILIPGILLRIKVEEKMLFEIEGYSTFAMSRKRLIPGVW